MDHFAVHLLAVAVAVRVSALPRVAEPRVQMVQLQRAAHGGGGGGRLVAVQGRPQKWASGLVNWRGFFFTHIYASKGLKHVGLSKNAKYLVKLCRLMGSGEHFT